MDPEISRVLRDIVDALDALAIPYAIGGSVASSVYGEPRSTHDIDVQVALHEPHLGPLLARLNRDYVISEELARSALANFSSFQALHKQLFLKVDLFVSGPGPLDREQLERRRPESLPAIRAAPIFVTAAENIVLRKLDWYRLGDGVSDRQWRDILGVLKIQGRELDIAYMREIAARVGLDALLRRALVESGLGGPA